MTKKEIIWIANSLNSQWQRLDPKDAEVFDKTIYRLTIVFKQMHPKMFDREEFVGLVKNPF